MLSVNWDTIRLFLHVLAATIWVGGPARARPQRRGPGHLRRPHRRERARRLFLGILLAG
ncbi:MAG TPA: hypothetical protein VMV92_03340 [Streptosporangiaceae bacterium]|nr:hypothetical protein [Streptosporangiaceae bacterium]